MHMCIQATTKTYIMKLQKKIKNESNVARSIVCTVLILTL